MLQDIRMDDIVRLRKQHPCGGFEWRIVRIGADIGLKCLTCSHRVLLSRRDFEKRLKKFVSRGPETSARILDALQSDLNPGQEP
jgi:hypothetical protein